MWWVVEAGAALFASPLRGITQTNTRLAAAPAHTTSDRALVRPTSFDCPRLGANYEG
jgi:hypothetical protein